MNEQPFMEENTLKKSSTLVQYMGLVRRPGRKELTPEDSQAKIYYLKAII